jgi:hypothetical protein
MGIDLKLLATSFRERDGEFLATASLRFDRDAQLLSQFGLNSVPCLVQLLPPNMKVGHYEDAGLRFDQVDRYGSALTYTTSAILRNARFPEGLSAWNAAVLRFLLALPAESRVVLYWC